MLKSYLIVWRGDEDDFFQTVVELEGDALDIPTNKWVTLAALAEGYSLDDARDLVERGYDCILVCDAPTNYYGG